jgi:hypothetical protein
VIADREETAIGTQVHDVIAAAANCVAWACAVAAQRVYAKVAPEHVVTGAACTIAGHTASANGKPAAVYYRSEIEAWRDQRAAVQQRAAEKLRTQATMHSPGRQSDAATEKRIAGIVERAVREHTLGPASPHLPASPTAPATNKRKISPRAGT